MGFFPSTGITLCFIFIFIFVIININAIIRDIIWLYLSPITSIYIFIYFFCSLLCLCYAMLYIFDMFWHFFEINVIAPQILALQNKTKTKTLSFLIFLRIDNGFVDFLPDVGENLFRFFFSRSLSQVQWKLNGLFIDQIAR